MDKTAIIVTNSYLKNDKLIRQVEILTELLNDRGVAVKVVKSNDIPIYVGNDGKLHFDVSGDFVIFYDKDARLCRMLELVGFRVFNNSDTMRICDDKMTTHIELAKIGIKMPLTISSPLVYSNENRDDEEFLHRVEERLCYPLIIKENYGSLGMQVYLIKSYEELLTAYRKLKHTPHLYQQFIGESYGRDIRVILINKKVVCAAERQSNGDFRSNLAQNGTMQSIELPNELARDAERVAEFLNFDYGSVDFLYGDNDDYYVCEVNSNAFFIGISAATNVNVAEKYVDYMLGEVYK